MNSPQDQLRASTVALTHFLCTQVEGLLLPAKCVWWFEEEGGPLAASESIEMA